MKQKNKISIAVALSFIALGIALTALKINVSSPIMSGIFAVGLSMLFVSLYKHFKFGEGVDEDERTKKVTARALSFSWFATLIIITMMMQADRLNVKLEAEGALGIVFFFMVLTLSAFRWYFDKKGEV